MRPELDFCLDKNHENLPFYRYGLMFFGVSGKTQCYAVHSFVVTRNRGDAYGNLAVPVVSTIP